MEILQEDLLNIIREKCSSRLGPECIWGAYYCKCTGETGQFQICLCYGKTGDNPMCKGAFS